MLIKRTWLLLAVLLLIPVCLAVWWWYYWPLYHESQLFSHLEKAMTGQQLDEANKILAELLRIAPDNSRAWFLYAEVLRRSNMDEPARSAISRAAKLGLAQKEVLRELTLLDAERDFDKVEEPLQQAIEANPDDVEVLEVLAKQYVKKQRMHDGERLYSHLIQLQPHRNEFRVARAEIYRKLLRWNEAANDLGAIVLQDPGNYDIRLQLAGCFMECLNIENAEPELLKCHEIRPEKSEPLVGLAVCAMNRGNLSRAQMLLTDALKMTPDAIPALDLQATLYLAQSKYDLACRLLENIVLLYPNNRSAHLKLAQALRRSGDLAGAREHERQSQALAHPQETPVPKDRQ